MRDEIDTPRRPRGRPRKSEDAQGASVQSLDRALGLLGAIAARDGVTLADMAAATGLATSTAHRILGTLESHGYVRQDAESGLWTIGVGAYTVGQAFVRIRKIETLSRPAMRALMEATGETVNLGVLEGREVVFLGQVECHAPIRAFFRPGRRGPAHASGIGKALLAQAPTCLAPGGGELERFTETTITSVEALNEELLRTRARGWALDEQEHTLGMRCIAAPVFNEHGEAIAAVSVSGPTVRVDAKAVPRIAALTVDAAAAITIAIGGRAPHNPGPGA